MKYPAFRPCGHEIQQGDLVVARPAYGATEWSVRSGLGIVTEASAGDPLVVILWQAATFRISKKILEVIGESG